MRTSAHALNGPVSVSSAAAFRAGSVAQSKHARRRARAPISLRRRVGLRPTHGDRRSGRLRSARPRANSPAPSDRRRRPPLPPKESWNSRRVGRPLTAPTLRSHWIRKAHRLNFKPLPLSMTSRHDEPTDSAAVTCALMSQDRRTETIAMMVTGAVLSAVVIAIHDHSGPVPKWGSEMQSVAASLATGHGFASRTGPRPGRRPRYLQSIRGS